jgi:protease I
MENKKIFMVVAPTDFKDDECFIPKEIFEKQGAEVRIASLDSGLAKSEGGKELAVDLAADEVKPSDFDAVVFVGGPGMGAFTKEPSFVDLARDFYAVGKITAAICVATVILANAGIVAGKAVTSWQGAQTELEEAGAEWTGEAVTVSEKIITASGPAAARKFAEAVVKGLG